MRLVNKLIETIEMTEGEERTLRNQKREDLRVLGRKVIHWLADDGHNEIRLEEEHFYRTIVRPPPTPRGLVFALIGGKEIFYTPANPPCGDTQELSEQGERVLLYHGRPTVLRLAPLGVITAGWVVGIVPKP